jgi:hypothetical protein
MQLTQCPEPACDGLAEIVDRFAVPSTSGLVEHVRVLCLHRHWFMLPVDSLKIVPAGRRASTTTAATPPAASRW